jgi:hypothetical protein
MSLCFSSIAEAPLSTASTSPQGPGNPKTPPRRTYTAVSDAKNEPDVR